MKARLTLRDLAKEVSWVAIEKATSKGGKAQIEGNEIHLGFLDSKQTPGVFNKVRLRFGKDVLKILGWKRKDKICVYHHPDNYFALRLIKSENGGGWKIKFPAGSDNGEIFFTWKLNVLPKFRKLSAIEYVLPRDEYVALIADFPDVN